MAKYETTLCGDFDELLKRMDDGIIEGSVSANCEDYSYCQLNDVRCLIRVYERYSFLGGNRLSLTMTLVGHGQKLFISVITAGGSQAIFFKINTLGEERFLKRAANIIENYKKGIQQ